mmetsp:Transcript_13081/g.52739  ORF Transcript_13081/g.52739 Transcript_13081/m.52739 type:complete len:219 (-) Transcript_13081:221-877(-)
MAPSGQNRPREGGRGRGRGRRDDGGGGRRRLPAPRAEIRRVARAPPRGVPVPAQAPRGGVRARARVRHRPRIPRRRSRPGEAPGPRRVGLVPHRRARPVFPRRRLDGAFPFDDEDDERTGKRGNALRRREDPSRVLAPPVRRRRGDARVRLARRRLPRRRGDRLDRRDGRRRRRSRRTSPIGPGRGRGGRRRDVRVVPASAQARARVGGVAGGVARGG